METPLTFSRDAPNRNILVTFRTLPQRVMMVHCSYIQITFHNLSAGLSIRCSVCNENHHPMELRHFAFCIKPTSFATDQVLVSP